MIVVVGVIGCVIGLYLYWGMNWFDICIDLLLVLEWC